MQQVVTDVATSLGSSGWAAQWSIILGAVGTLITSGVAAYKSIQNGRKANQIAEQTNGHLSKLREDLADSTAKNIALELELRVVYAAFSARSGMPVADLRQMVRHEDAPSLPASVIGKPRRPASDSAMKRRRTDRFVTDRKEDGK